MKFSSPCLAGMSAWLLMAVVHDGVAQSLTRPLSGKGADAKTLLVYTDTRVAYSLSDSLAVLKMQVQRVATKLETIPVSQADAGKLAAADYVVVFCPQPFPALSKEFLQAIVKSEHPVLWVGFGAEELSQLPPLDEQFKVAPYAATNVEKQVHYLNRDWNERFFTWLPAEIMTNSPVNVIMTVPVEEKGQIVQHPICWRSGQLTFFTALPTSTPSGALFSDLLLDFFGVTQVNPSAVGIRIDGYYCRQNHQEFRRLVDQFKKLNRPFMVSVIPAYWDEETKKVLELDSQPEFVSALRYAQQHGGRLVMDGYRAAYDGRTGMEPEFWDAALDRPLAGKNSAEFVRERVRQGIRQMLKKGLFPIAWETPHYAASSVSYAEIANHFSTAVERVQLSDASARETYAGSAIAPDAFGRLIVPENLGAISTLPPSLTRVQSRAEVLTQLRGTVSICSFPAYLAEERLIQTVKVLEDFRLPFLDLAVGDHWVQLPEAILLTGNAERRVTLKSARVNWKAYDRGGKLLAQEQGGQSMSGEQVFKRRGQGDYELFEINEAKP